MTTKAMFRTGVIAVIVATISVVAADASALTRSCGSDAVANTNNVLCASPSGPCTATSVTLSTAIDVTSGGCDFDLGGRDLTIQKALQVTALGFVTIRNARAITMTSGGRLKARGDFVEPQGYIIPGGTITLSGTGDVTIGGVIDVSGDPAGLVALTTPGNVTLQNGAVLQAKGMTSFVSDGERVSDGGTVSVISTAGNVTIGASAGGVILATGTEHGEGGDVEIQGARAIGINGIIDASGGEGDGGSVMATAGDDINVTKDIQVDSRGGGGFGGEIALQAGVDTLGGITPGGGLTINDATLQLSGSSLGGFGGDGGDLLATAAGPLRLIGNNVSIRASAGSDYDGWGGTVTLASNDGDDSTIGPLDGDLTLGGIITAHAGSGGGFGGELDLFAGRTLTTSATITLTGDDGGGSLEAHAGGSISLGGSITAEASTAAGSGGSIECFAGSAQDATLTVATSLFTAAGNSGAFAPFMTLSSCFLTVNTGIKLSAGTGTAHPAAPVIQLLARHPMQLNANAQFLANPGSVVATIHPPGQNPVIGTGVVFNPSRSDQALATHPLYQQCGQ
jgi:hypothetical protein